MRSFFQIFKASPEVEKSMQVTDNFLEYLNILMHSWLKTLLILGFTLVPIFFILDIFIIPEESRDLLPKFGLYRFVSTVIVIVQLVVVLNTKPSRFSLLHGYVFNFVVCGAIVLMTVDLGGFKSPYYAGLNLVVIAVNLLLPWKAIHSALNGTFTLVVYILANQFFGGDYELNMLINDPPAKSK